MCNPQPHPLIHPTTQILQTHMLPSARILHAAQLVLCRAQRHSSNIVRGATGLKCRTQPGADFFQLQCIAMVVSAALFCLVSTFIQNLLDYSVTDPVIRGFILLCHCWRISRSKNIIQNHAGVLAHPRLSSPSTAPKGTLRYVVKGYRKNRA